MFLSTVLRQKHNSNKNAASNVFVLFNRFVGAAPVVAQPGCKTLFLWEMEF
jgi:hypothetical protein